MTKCSYCHTEIEQGTGKLYIRKDGKAFPLCASKCEKNWIKLKRKPLQLKWTNAHRDFKARQKKKTQ